MARGYESGKRKSVKKNFRDKVHFTQGAERTKQMNYQIDATQKRGGIRL